MDSAIAKATKRDRWPLSFAERQMVIEQDMDPKSIAYNMGHALEITGPFDIRRL